MILLYILLGFLIGFLISIPRKRELKQEISDLQETKNILEEKKNLLEENIRNFSQQAAQQFLDNELSTAKQKYEEQIRNYRQGEEEAEEQYLQILKDFKDSALESKQKMQESEDKLKELKDRLSAAVAALKRDQEKKDKINFYKLVLSPEDLKEVEQLRQVGKYLRNVEPLNKVIWSVYYQKPTSDLIGRVVGKKEITGIYKITNLLNGMTYVGQSVNIGNRFVQHIKRGLGAEAITNNKLYPAMKEFGVENFSFEIIEECNKSELNKKEKEWQIFFHATDYGYSMK